MTKHAVITENMALEDLCNHAIENGLTHLWVAGYSIHRKDYQLSQVWDALPNWKHKPKIEAVVKDNLLCSVHAYKKVDNRKSWRFNIIFLKDSKWKTIAKLPLDELLPLVSELESLLGVPVSGSSSGTGWRYLEKILKEKHPQWLGKLDAVFAALPFEDSACPLIWQRKPSTDELNKKYCYSYDKNAAYPYSAKKNAVGIGQPVHNSTAVFDAKLPGMWRIETDYQQDPRLPDLIFQGQEWFETHVVKMLVQTGATVRVLESWTFPKSHCVFKEWADNLWAMRSPATGVLRKVLKNIMTNTLGLTRSVLVEDSIKYRPDWNAMVVGDSSSLMYYNARKCGMLGFYPFMCYIDALYFFSDDPNPETAVPGLAIKPDTLGCYKLNWKLEVTDEVKATLLTDSCEADKLEQLNDIAERNGY